MLATLYAAMSAGICQAHSVRVGEEVGMEKQWKKNGYGKVEMHNFGHDLDTLNELMYE
jgi:hypothetical protein